MATFTITSLGDTAGDTSIGTLDPTTGVYTGTLREAINFANQNVGNSSTPTTITVENGLSGTITLAGNLPLVTTSIDLDGGGLTLNGAGAYRGFLISAIAANGINAAPPVGISNLTIADVKARGGHAGGVSAGGGLGARDATFPGPAADVTSSKAGMTRAPALGGSSGEPNAVGPTVTEKTLAAFDGTDGEYPTGLLIDGSGDLFGVTSNGGPITNNATAEGDGTIFEIPASSGQLTTLHSFGVSIDDGEAPNFSLSMDASGNLYGATTFGGTYGDGTVFTFKAFQGGSTYGQIADLGGPAPGAGRGPFTGVYVAPDGTIYGTTALGGMNGTGTVFSIPSGSSTPTYTSFPASASGGLGLNSALINIGTSIYGTTFGDKTASPGTIFSFNTQTSTMSTVATFNPKTGYATYSGVVADSAGDLYGTTSMGAANGDGSIYEYNASTGSLTTLAAFSSATGYNSNGDLLRDGAGDLFGTAGSGGADDEGTVFELKAGSSTITDLYNFTAGADGSEPSGNLVADKAGNLYGTTTDDGAQGHGTVFEISGAGFVPVCFAAGTRIRTARGGAPVEQLRVGDLAITASGVARPIRWLGIRTIDCRRRPRPHEVMPMRVAAHAFGDNRPSRDLTLSPGHSICLDLVGEVLIPVSALVNGATIRQLDVDTVTYWHVELDSHDILLAENLPCESYLDMGNRCFFAGGEVVALEAAPDADPAQRTHADFCRPFLDAGPLVEGIKGQLRRRAVDLGWALTDALELHLEVDGRWLDPVVRGLSARFRVPAGAEDVWLVSPTSRPCDMRDSNDTRDLGLHVAALRIMDGFSSPCAIAIDDPLLGSGFHEVEEDGCRWTAGRARLPSALWEDRDADFYLCLDLAGKPVARWQSPPAETVNRMKRAI